MYRRPVPPGLVAGKRVIGHQKRRWTRVQAEFVWESAAPVGNEVVVVAEAEDIP
ncbi:hypothetical protein [Novipirellula galeiformis]|uniref:hypothetical protein n=1 Tax=Novipirellula galeiformis TaxID=2528004 RepID=UPI0018CD92F5|nr:hypothetical protein [Novipirellula galeiformis]